MTPHDPEDDFQELDVPEAAATAAASAAATILTPKESVDIDPKLEASIQRALTPASRLDKPTPTSDLTPDTSRILTTEGARTGVLGNKIMAFATKGSAITVLIVLAAVGAFLLAEAWPAIASRTLELRPMGSSERVGLFAFTAPQVFGTILGAVIAMLLSVPFSIGVALTITHYAPRRMSSLLGYTVDLLAAVPSVVYGLWGALFLLPLLTPVHKGLNATFGWIPFFGGEPSTTGRTILSAAVVLSVMILPIITAVIREVVDATPKHQEDAALALGATRWEMIRMVVLPMARSGMVSAAMLGLGRALGETMAVLMVLSVGSSMTWSVVEAGKHSSIAPNIALQFPESSGIDTSALVATGLVLFLITLLVNTGARLIVARAERKAAK
ncbi:MAG: phosphate ABC transporter permease subunit PstC [Actinomycetaceae bacterium]|nr:phosphate ABC transporter permease subunit PstC [Actinomycetaceae bacterium]